MTDYVLADLTSNLREAQHLFYEAGLQIHKRGAGAVETKKQAEKIQNVARNLAFPLISLELLQASSHAAALVRIDLRRERMSCAVVESHFRELLESTHWGLGQMRIALIPYEKQLFINSEALFGNKVRKEFPSAAPDIKESGNCMAVGLNTAAIFHLMRAVEHGIRALAQHFNVKVIGKKKKTPVDMATWDQAITEIDRRISKKLRSVIPLSGQPKHQTATKRPKSKLEADKVFYRTVIHELLAFKDVWRNHVMHTHGAYTDEDVMHAYAHTRAFMERLATRVSERKVGRVK